MRTILAISLAVFVSLIASSVFASGLRFRAELSGAQETPTVATDGTGEVEVEFDDAFTKVNVRLTVSNTVGAVVAAHFHCARPGANGPVAFGLFSPGPLAFDGEKAEGVLTNADFTGAPCMATIGRPVSNIAALAFAMRDGLIYTNVHTTFALGGELRGQLLPDGDGDGDDDDD